MSEAIRKKTPLMKTLEVLINRTKEGNVDLLLSEIEEEHRRRGEEDGFVVSTGDIEARKSEITRDALIYLTGCSVVPVTINYFDNGGSKYMKFRVPPDKFNEAVDADRGKTNKYKFYNEYLKALTCLPSPLTGKTVGYCCVREKHSFLLHVNLYINECRGIGKIKCQVQRRMKARQNGLLPLQCGAETLIAKCAGAIADGINGMAKLPNKEVKSLTSARDLMESIRQNYVKSLSK